MKRRGRKGKREREQEGDGEKLSALRKRENHSIEILTEREMPMGKTGAVLPGPSS